MVPDCFCSSFFRRALLVVQILEFSVGRRKKTEICLQISKRLKKNHTFHLTIWELEDCRAEIAPIQLLLWGCRGRVLYDILTYCPIKAKFSSN